MNNANLVTWIQLLGALFTFVAALLALRC